MAEKKKFRIPRFLTRTAPSALPRHGASTTRRPWATVLRVTGLSAAVALVSLSAIVAITTWKITQEIDTVAIEGETGTDAEVKLAAIGAMKGAFNVLIVGTDTREGQRAMFGDVSSALNDVNIVIHVSKDHTRATAVSIPRDMVVPLPACPRPDGSSSGAASGLPINTALSYGGLNCVVRTVENLTHLKIKYAGLVTFGGVASLADAVGGVEVCIDAPITDSYTGLNLPKKGKYVLDGYRALAFLRSRHGVGDGSDLGRISSQQVYLSSLVRKIQDEGVLLNPASVYSLASTAARHMTLSRSLSSVDTMVAMALVLKDIPRENIIFAQYPGTTGVGGIYSGKVAPLTDIANTLFAAIRKDKPFRLAEDSTGPGSTLKGKATAKTKGVLIPGVRGQSAAQKTCSVSYHY